MKTKIKIIQDYFLNKIYNCEFEIVDKNEYRTTIIIDGDCRFVLWTATEISMFRTYEGTESFMKLILDAGKSKDAWNYVQEHGRQTESEIRAGKIELIEKLTKELNE